MWYNFARMAFMRNIFAFILSVGPLLADGLLFAADLSITFNTALTNGTDWVYGSGVAVKKEGDYPYIRAQDGGYIASPVFDFAITSITLVAWNSSENTKREAEILPQIPTGLQGSPPASHKLSLTASPQAYTFSWPRECLVRAFTIQSIDKTGSSGSINFHSAAIAGYALTPTPTKLATSQIRRDSFVASWENDAIAKSNLVYLLRKDLMTFDSVPATSNTTSISACLLGPGFEGANLYSVSNGNGIVQIGTGKKQGWLSYSNIPSSAGRHLVLIAQPHPYKDEGKTLLVQWVLNDSTNDIAQLTLDTNLREYTVDLSPVPNHARLLLHSPRKTNGRILLSAFGFTQTIAQNLIPHSGPSRLCHFRFSNLTPLTDYLWLVYAFSGDAMSSPPSAYQPVRTTSLPPPPFVIRVR